MLKIENAGRYIIGGSFSGLGMPAAQGRCVSVSRNTPGSRILLCLPWSAEGLRWHPLSGIEKPGSGCPSDVKSAGHPESGFPIPLSGDAAALCAPREIQKNPAARSIPGYRPRFQVLSSGHSAPWKNAKSVRQLPVQRPLPVGREVRRAS